MDAGIDQRSMHQFSLALGFLVCPGKNTVRQIVLGTPSCLLEILRVDNAHIGYGTRSYYDGTVGRFGGLIRGRLLSP